MQEEGIRRWEGLPTIAFEPSEASRFDVAEVGAVVLARMDSRRFPAKILCSFMGQELIGFLTERLLRIFVPRQVVIATSHRPVDDQIARFCQERDLQCFRGSTENVAHRAVCAAKEHGWRWFVRVNGDSPLVDPALVTQATQLAVRNDLDLATNLVPRSFPYGISAEVVKTDVLERLLPQMRADEPEHVTAVLYRHLDALVWQNISQAEDHSHIRMTIDTPEDLRAMQQWLSLFDRRTLLDATFRDFLRQRKAA